MRIRKGVKIHNVDISSDGTVTAKDVSCNTIALTRTQRNILSNYKHPDYIRLIVKEYNNPDILHEDYTVTKNGQIVYTYTK